MAGGGNNQRSNGSRFSKPYDVSNSFVKKVASRVSGYLGGWFGTPTPSQHADDTNLPDLDVAGTSHAADVLDTPQPGGNMQPPAKRMKVTQQDSRYDFQLPISPIPSITRSDDFLSLPGPSGLQSPGPPAPPEPPEGLEAKSNGQGDDSESSESTSGCSSLVPQSDRLSQASQRKLGQGLEEKLSYARLRKQSNDSLYLQVPVQPGGREVGGARRKPCFDISAYGSQFFDKAAVKEKMVNSPFYTGQTSYGGASACRPRAGSQLRDRHINRHSRHLNSFNSSFNRSASFNTSLGAGDRREALQVTVKPSHGSTEDLSNMSHTAKRILEALEQFSSPLNDAKRIPVPPASRAPPLLVSRRGKRPHLESGTGPPVRGLAVPTVPDLLKLRRLERIQDSTAAAREMTKEEGREGREYQVGGEGDKGGKVVTRRARREGAATAQQLGLEQRLPEVNLPKVVLPITTLPKFDLAVLPPSVVPKATPPAPAPLPPKPTPQPPPTSSRSFAFAPPLTLPGAPSPASGSHAPRSVFTFSEPLPAAALKLKLRRKEKAEMELKAGSVMDVLEPCVMDKCRACGVKPCACGKTGDKCAVCAVCSVRNKAGEKCASCQAPKNSEDKVKKATQGFGDIFKKKPGQWECGSCMVNNQEGSEKCVACETAKPGAAIASAPTGGFGDLFKKKPGQWECGVCMISNKEGDVKCVACETAKPVAQPKTTLPAVRAEGGFGDAFKKKAGQWECGVCMVSNKAEDVKCVACETAKPGAQQSTVAGFGDAFKKKAGQWECGVCMVNNKEGADKCVACETARPGTQPSQAKLSNGPSVTTSHGVFTFGIPSSSQSTPAFTTPETKGFTFPPAVTTQPAFTFGVTKETKETPAFTFGVKPAAQVKTPAAETKDATSFTIGANTAPAAAPAAAPAFAFGRTPAVEETKPTGFGVSSGTKVTPAFTFGAKHVEAKQEAPAFSFGVKSSDGPKETAAFTFGAKSESAQRDAAVRSAPTEPPAQEPAPAFSFGTSKPVGVFGVKTDTSAVSKPAGVFGVKTDTSAVSKPPGVFGVKTDSSKPAGFVFGASNKPEVKSDLSYESKRANFEEPAAKKLFKVKKDKSESSAPQFSFGGLSKTDKSPFAFVAPKALDNKTDSMAPAFSNFSSKPELFPSETRPQFGSTTGFNGALPVSSEAPQSVQAASSAPAVFNSAFNSTPSPFSSSGFTTPSFGGFGAAASSFPSAPAAFGTPTPSPAPAGFPAPAKPAASFIFGNSGTPAAAPAAGVFTFGAAKSEDKPAVFGASFGQNGQAFGFGSGPAASSNVFGSFPAKPAGFGTPSPATPTPFGQTSAPAAFGTTAAAQPFQFTASAAPAPASAPAQPFSLSVPSTFNFTGGQTPSFTAEPSSTTSQPRRVIKAVRRAQHR